MVWRGGDRFTRCLASISASQHHFARVVLSVTSDDASDDMRRAVAFQAQHTNVEVICTNEELPTMEHQAFWIDYLTRTGANSDDWIYWLAYDDEVRVRGIDAITDDEGNWPLQEGTVYFGPWAMRHEQADDLWAGDPGQELESWTSFPPNGPTRLPVLTWIADQITQPTYMQMSGSVNQFRSFLALRDLRPRKRGPMRIEMAIAAAPGTTHVEEFAEPVSTIYGRSNSDRATYGSMARKEDLHLAVWMARHAVAHPQQALSTLRAFAGAGIQTVSAVLDRSALPHEEWRVRGTITP